MFTGIIHSLGTVAAFEPLDRGLGLPATGGGGGGTARLSIVPDRIARAWKPREGDSIAVDGCCLTLAQPCKAGTAWVFHVVPETLSKTTLGSLRPGVRVHLERAAGAQSLLDGHVVQGHVDGVARVVQVRHGADWRIRLMPPPGLLPFIVPKGSVSLAGVSLTVAAVDPGSPGRHRARARGEDHGWFEVALIPVTLERTLLGLATPGGGINLECDPIAKTVVHYLQHFLAAGRPAKAGAAPRKKRGASRRG